MQSPEGEADCFVLGTLWASGHAVILDEKENFGFIVERMRLIRLMISSRNGRQR